MANSSVDESGADCSQTMSVEDRVDKTIKVYGDFIAEIRKRLDAVSNSLSELKANPDHVNAWQNCDFCWFQIRKICEYLALGIVAAHHLDGAKVADLHKWRPKDLLGQAAKLNDFPTPILISGSFGKGNLGERQIKPLARPIKPEVISAIYGRCSEVLHLGSLDRILAEKLPAYDVGQLETWLAAFERLMANHVLLLPDIQTILMSWTAGEGQKFFALGSDGATFDTSDLPEFEI